jgi:hypothetical protein
MRETTLPKREATVEDLYRVGRKAEIVNGDLVLMSPTGTASHSARMRRSTSGLPPKGSS